MKYSTLKIAQQNTTVAPRAGGRGLKCCLLLHCISLLRRPPRRGAWIEISLSKGKQILIKSPPAQGGVD